MTIKTTLKLSKPRNQTKKEKLVMASVSRETHNPAANNGKLLKGSDLEAAGLDYAGGVILRVDKAPDGFQSPFIVRFDSEVVPGINSMPLNVTNSRFLAARIGDNTDTWAGWGIIIETKSVQNPQTKNRAIGMVVTDAVKPEDVRKGRKSKPTVKEETVTEHVKAKGLPF